MVGIKSYGEAHLLSRNNKSFDGKYPAIGKAHARLPHETVIDGEVVALDESGMPSFNALQNGSATAQRYFYVFDVLVLAAYNVMAEPLPARHEPLFHQVVPRRAEPIREAPNLTPAFPTCSGPSASRGWMESSPEVLTAPMSPVSLRAYGGRCGSIGRKRS